MKPAIPVLVSACTAVLLLAACEDSETRRRSEVQASIISASAELQRATAQLAAPDRRGDLEQKLNQVIRQLGDTGDGDPGQRAAAAQLACSAHRRLGWIALEQAYEIEAGQRARRDLIHGLVQVATRLDSMVAGLDAIRTEELQDELAQARLETSQALTTFSEQVASLDGPMAEHSQQNRAARQEVDRLREEARLLHNRAAELGPAAGYSTLARGLDLDRQADRIEYDLAQREIEMRYTTESEHALAGSAVQRIRDRLEAIDGASSGLDELAGTADQEARATLALLGEIREAIDAALGELDGATGELDRLYERAAEAFDRSASTAKSAATWVRGNTDVADAVRLAAAQGYQELGRVHLAKAWGLDDQAALLERLVATGMVETGGAQRTARTLRQAAQEAAGQGSAAYANAGGVLDQVSGQTTRAQLERLKARMSSLESAVTGEPVAAEPVAAPAPAARAASTPTRTPAEAPASVTAVYGRGAESPQALVAALAGVSDIVAVTRFNLDYSWVELNSPDEREFYESAIRSSRATLDLEDAFGEMYGTGFMAMSAQAMSGGQMAEVARLIGAEVALGDVSGDRGTIQVTADGETDALTMVRADGRWYIDGTEQARELLASSNPQMAGMVQTMTTVMRDLAGRVRAGEFASIQDAMMAMGQAMQTQASGGGP